MKVFYGRKGFQIQENKDSLLNTAGYMSFDVLGKYFLLATSNQGFILYNQYNR